jgi:phosphoadenosine phosphosulfate reductase
MLIIIANFIIVLEQQAVRIIYKMWFEKKDEIDVFEVAFSGGKDSIVLLNLVKKALPQDAYVVVFADTQMELKDTYETIQQIESQCKAEGIRFYRAKSHIDAKEGWQLFGPPSRNLRWCCTVLKTAPVISLLREELNAQKVIMITGVRSEESSKRASYEEFSLGKKVANQYSFHPILDWSSTEIFLYTYYNNLLLNEAYKSGLSRVGCLVCPNSSGTHECIKKILFSDEVDEYLKIITETSTKDLSGRNNRDFLENGGWKMRTTAHELTLKKKLVDFNETQNTFLIIFDQYLAKWMTWYRIIGECSQIRDNEFELSYKDKKYKAIIRRSDGKYVFEVHVSRISRVNIEFVHYLRVIFIKTYYCVGCGDCVAECTNGNISQKGDIIVLGNKCTRCMACLKIVNGCTYYSSIRDIAGVKIMTGLNRYLSIGVKKQWIIDFFDTGYEPGGRKTDVLYGFLADAGVLKKKHFTPFGEKIKQIGLSKIESWGLMLCELVYTAAFKWFVKNIPFERQYTFNDLNVALGNLVTEKAKGEFWNSFKQILLTMPYGEETGFGIPDYEIKTDRSGEQRITLHNITRSSWISPPPAVILYSLYKFAEKCGGYYEFTLDRLYNYAIDSDAISPTQIFGITEDRLTRIINGLAAVNSDFVTAKLTHGLNTILLNKNKSASDVLSLL